MDYAFISVAVKNQTDVGLVVVLVRLELKAATLPLTLLLVLSQ